mmetsp:Transcript_130/g.451  ORF Transcript_130/g.451 Transcript_130/m.451 type:complete len:267 (-) Transcript_130:129-929(-)
MGCSITKERVFELGEHEAIGQLGGLWESTEGKQIRVVGNKCHFNNGPGRTIAVKDGVPALNGWRVEEVTSCGVRWKKRKKTLVWHRAGITDEDLRKLSQPGDKQDQGAEADMEAATVTTTQGDDDPGDDSAFEDAKACSSTGELNDEFFVPPADGQRSAPVESPVEFPGQAGASSNVTTVPVPLSEPDLVILAKPESTLVLGPHGGRSAPETTAACAGVASTACVQAQRADDSTLGLISEQTSPRHVILQEKVMPMKSWCCGCSCG